MKIDKVNLHVIKMELKKPFSTHLGTVKDREGIIVEVVDENGIRGYGEGVAFSTPWYTEETVGTTLHILKEVLIPLLLKSTLVHPREASSLFSTVRRNNMAKAALECAVWDLFSKQLDEPLWKVLGGTREVIAAGAVAGAPSVTQTIEQVHEFVRDGYERIKVKISPSSDYELIKEIRQEFPYLRLMADANSAFTLDDIERLKRLDEFHLEMIEQPLGIDDIFEHSLLQKDMKTSICLDESITSFHDAKSALALGSCGYINIKLGRVGGYSTAVSIHDLCGREGVRVWCGGMLEFGISRAHNIALSTLEGFDFPGDISSSSRYWEQDIIEPEIQVINGKINVSKEAGIGVELNRKRLKEVTLFTEEYSL
ncbi:o-succinylbenzoate synthase [Rossellomorea vietnamensis]|uniref:o-succinylbenzoate synthase n=1 Tax=Rossellomorea vietnamensis TaxID=218284 RepID=A0A5D4K6E2_9BACI|nr:o-succinylbenzoate synthase [Rossellomorea vietnamensis]TYR72848.1 o-succinylbenzoate synthase [Rossellomorea vietnamensis]